MDGIIIVNKTKGCTSHNVVYKVKKLLGEKVGHTGTLDPNATGVLPLLIGKGTQMSKYLINHDKIYEVVLKLGEKMDTADSEGTIIEKKDVKQELLEEDYIKDVFYGFIGRQKQIPPMYSAIKVKGKKLYEYARRGEEVKVEPREIEIYSLELIDIFKENNEIAFRVSCSKGTYVRSLCEDIASKLDTVGYMKELNRTQVGEFNIQHSITVEELQKNYQNKEFMKNNFISIEHFLKDAQTIVLNEIVLRKFLNGMKLKCNQQDGVYRIYSKEDIFIGTGVVKDKILKRDVIV